MAKGSQGLVQGSVLPKQALGIGLRVQHYQSIHESPPPIDYFEVISENFMGNAEPPLQHLDLIAQKFPVVLHGVGLNLLGHEALDEDYLEALVSLADRLDAPFVSDHVAWNGAHGIRHHDLLPTPFTKDLLAYAAERAALVQERLGRPFALENLSSYVRFPESEMDEATFYSALVRESGVSFMLDINNIYVSSCNHGFDAKDYLAAIDFSKVLQVHVAGHDATNPGLIIDTHDRAVAAGVWQLYEWAWTIGGPFPTLLEWDEKIPPLPEVLSELDKARSYQS